jgi:Na+/pantothenate symporter
MEEPTWVTRAVFLLYIVAVFVVAAFSHQVLNKKSFLAEYFLGSRGLGTWTLAFTFAATSASGGSFGGYPSLIYSHGWVLAFWIASYMVFPLTTMGVIGKRLNEVARKSGAITIPDVLRDRHESVAIGLLASAIIIVFNSCMLLAQFKLGAIIVQETFGLQSAWAYEIGLAVFAVTVVFYTAYGGFRAVVWTDVMQGLVMGLGIMLLLPIVLWKIQGLPTATKGFLSQPPLLVTSVNGRYNDLALRSLDPERVPAELIYRWSKGGDATLPAGNPKAAAQFVPGIVERPDRTTHGSIEVVLAPGATANDVRQAIESDPTLRGIVSIEIPYKNEEFVETDAGPAQSLGATGEIPPAAGGGELRFHFVHGHEFVFGPGRKNGGQPFHPLGMAISYFFIWAILGIAQPGTMVRLMAFQDSRTLQRSIMTVTLYYAMIYLPLVIVVLAARSKLPVLTPEDSDRTIVLIATRLVAKLGLGYEVLGAILIAAPFAAVMSTVDSLLLQVSSSAVRDVMQRVLMPEMTERAVKIASYTATVIVGTVVTLWALSPPNFLQVIIVFGSAGFASTFLFPMTLSLYWPGMTRQGTLASMLTGFVMFVALFAWGRVDLMGIYPALWAMLGSLAAALVVSKLSGPPATHLVERYFY